MKHDPEAVAEVCDWPTNEADLHARHIWLHGLEGFRERMENEPEFYDVKIAGYWIWGLSCWIGHNFAKPARNSSVPHLTGGQGVARQVPHLTGGQGVARQVPHLTGGKGDFDIDSSPISKSESQANNLRAWFNAISNRMRFTKVCCGDWERVLSKAATWGQGITGILLDPPYDTEGHDDVYGELSRGMSGKVRDWAIENSKNALLRIALCGYENEHEMPSDWECIEWKASGGYGNLNADNNNRHRERIWFSPHCIKPEPELFKL